MIIREKLGTKAPPVYEEETRTTYGKITYIIN